MSTQTDLLGNPLSPMEHAVLAAHTALRELAARGDLTPCVEANTKAALALTWQMANDLDLPVGDEKPL